MPHVAIKHFPADLEAEAKERLAEDIAAAITRALGSRDGAISIALEAVEKDRWMEAVYKPEIENCPGDLIKAPDY